MKPNEDTSDLPLWAMARRTDPKTSHDAAKRHAAEALAQRRLQVLKLVRAHPGSTAGELGQYTQDPDTPGKRLPELEKMGWVERGAKRLCRKSGYTCATWNERTPNETES